MADLRVFVVADDPLARAGLAALLVAQSEFVVTGQVAAGPDLAGPLALHRPDVVLWDLGWDPDEIPPDLEEIEGPVVVLLPDETLAADAWSAGLRNLGLRDAVAEQLVAALLAAAQGLITLVPALAEAVLPLPGRPPEALVEDLTPRELEVLQLMTEGLSNRAIGQELEISAHTVKFHVTALMGKLGAQSRTEAVVRATRLGLIIL